MRVIAATGSFYFARGIDSQASVGAAVDEEHWAEETACKRKRIEISLVFVTIMLHVLTYVVSHKLFWNWNSVVRFVSQEVWFDKGFVIWIFRNYCLVQILSLWLLSIGVQIIFTTNELVDRIRNLTWNASRMIKKRIFYEKNTPQVRFFMK